MRRAWRHGKPNQTKPFSSHLDLDHRNSATPLVAPLPFQLSMLNRLRRSIRASTSRQARTLTMAWYCSGSTNTELVENLFKVGLIKNERVKEAMLGVSHTCFTPHSASAPLTPDQGRSSSLRSVAALLGFAAAYRTWGHHLRTAHARPRVRVPH